MKTSPKWFKTLSVGSLITAVAFPTFVKAQVFTDNFDSYSSLTELVAVGGWQYVPASAGITVSLPANGTGKAVRIQTPNGSLASIFRTNILYTDFYIGADVVKWDNTTDQAIILQGRATNQAGVAATKDYTMNYDVLQDGDTPGDRRGAQLQMIRVDSVSPLALGGIAVSEFTLPPSGSYRFIFKGVGPDLTGQIYDLTDLTQPLITLNGNDTTYTEGASGIGVFDRSTAAPALPTDVSYDNYYAGAVDPNLDIAPAIRHSVPGTPQVVTRTPVNRFTNFHPPGSGIAFTVRTFTANQIDTAATKLFLNGVDVSASLAPVPANGTNASFVTAPGTLQSNTVYTARIEVQDAAGTLKSTNIFWFDTFSDAYLLSGGTVKTIEAEDYNYDNGKFLSEPVPVSGFTSSSTQVGGAGVGYLDLAGVSGVDFQDNGTQLGSGLPPDYRISDFVGTQQGQIEIQDGNLPFQVLNDHQRSQYVTVDVKEYQVRRFDPTEWLNYTRVFADADYNVYLRVGTLDSSSASLDLVTSDPTMASQTTSPLGTFTVPNTFMRSNYRYVPLMDGGNLATVNLSGTKTVRLTSTGIPTKDNRLMNPNYLLFVGASVPVVTLLSSGSVAGPYAAAAGASVNTSTKTITVPLSGDAQFYRVQSGTAVTITGISQSGGNIVITYN